MIAFDIFAALRASADADPEAIAIAAPTSYIKRGDLVRGMDAVSAAALANGIRPGQLVVVRTANQEARLPLHLGLLQIGCRVSATGALDVYAQNDVAVDALITDDPQMLGQAASGRRRDGSEAKRLLPLTPQWFAIDPLSRRGVVVADDHAMIYASSGSTGTPKLIEVDRLALAQRIESMARNPEFAGQPRHLIATGYATINILRDMLAVLINGGTVFRSGELAPQQLVDAIRLFQPSCMMTTPAILSDVLNVMIQAPTSIRRLEAVRVSGAFCIPEIQRLAVQHLTDRMIASYGSTELCSISRQTFEEGLPTGIVGRLRDDIEVMTTDDAGHVLPAGTEGHIRMRSTSSLAGRYIAAGPSLADIFSDGWFKPGDFGWLDADRNLFITGRSSQVINLGGDKINPEVLEGWAAQYQGVADFGVAGFMRADGRVELRGAVVSKQPIRLDQLNAHLLRKDEKYGLSSLQQIDSMPRTENRKIDRNALRRLLE